MAHNEKKTNRQPGHFRVNIVEEEPPRREKPRKRGWLRLLILIVVVVGLAVFLAFYALSLSTDLLGINQTDRQAEVEIPMGSSVMDISRILRDEEIISHPYVFSLYAKLTKTEDYQAGTYILNEDMNYKQILIALQSGNSIKETVTITFVEGETLQEIAAKLEENEVCDAEEFIETADTVEFGYEFEQRIPDNEKRFHKLEGYLFPDTYEFYVGEDPEMVIRRFLDNFESKITPELEARMQEMNLTLDETITLASIIQKEASGEDNMYQVSSVFHNRLEPGSGFDYLQSDVTVFYVEDDIYQQLGIQDESYMEAYSTYDIAGLPVGPICNPGLAVIEAALYPADTNYYFFVTDSQGNYYYATTAEEHYANVRRAALN